VFQIGGNTFYDRKNKIPIKIPEFKRSGIGIIAEFHGILSGFPNQGHLCNSDAPSQMLLALPHDLIVGQVSSHCIKLDHVDSQLLP
jgi:hypothetical protein